MRNHFIDNAKGLLIILVVLGHYLRAVLGWEEWQDGLAKWLFIACYMFHMPAFVFLAGVTAKCAGLGKRIAVLTVTLIVFRWAYEAPFALKDALPLLNPLFSFGVLWFLLSLIWWLALLPLMARLPFALPIVVGLALAAGAHAGIGSALSAARTLVFMPFFILGHLYGPKIMQSLPTSLPIRLAAMAFFCALATLLWAFDLNHLWYMGSLSYKEAGLHSVYGAMIRGGLMMTAAAASYAFFVIVPSKESWLSRVGKASLSVYLLHEFCIRTSSQSLKQLAAEYCRIGPERACYTNYLGPSSGRRA